MPKIHDNAIVLRGGTVTDKSVRDGAASVQGDVVKGLSVQVWDSHNGSFTHKQTLLKLLAPVPNEAYALARAKDITDAGGEIKWQKVVGNPYHAVINGLTVDDIVSIFKRNQYEELRGG